MYRQEATTNRTSEEGMTPFSPPLPCVVSTTLTGNDAEIVAGALRTVVDWVDWCLIVDTGISDNTLETVRAVAGDKLVVRQFSGHEDPAAAKNFALAAAAEIGGEWALM